MVHNLEEIEQRLKELQVKEGELKVREESVAQRSLDLDERETKCAEKEQSNLQRESSIDTKTKKWETDNQMEKNTSLLPSLIFIDVRGRKYITAKSSLLKQKGSYFEDMLQSNHHQQVDGKFFIDRNEKLFDYVWEFITTGEMPVPENDEIMQSLKEEFEFYNIPFPFPSLPPLNIVVNPPEPASPPPIVTLHSPSSANILEEHKIIEEWLPNRQFQLLYKASIDGYEGYYFHDKCDNKGPTLTIIQSNEGYLFGGYSEISWDSSATYKSHPDCFLFTLSNPHQIPPTKYMLKAGNPYAVRGYPNHGPTFGSGADIHVSNLCNLNNSSGTGFPSSYNDTTGKGYKTFTGDENFTVSEVEVYSVV